MQGLTVIEILRHLSVGVVAFALGYFLEPGWMKSVWESLGAVGISLGAFVLGAVLYYLYRPTVMTRLLLPLKDWLCRNCDNYRTYLTRRYSGMSPQDAEIFWFSIRGSDHASKLEGFRKETSGIHFLYLTSLQIFLGSIYGLVFQWPVLAVGLLTTGIVVGGCGLLLDLDLERLEYFLLRSKNQEELDRAAKAIGFPRSSGADEAS